jgi:branched-chain amino acid aminotransferase
MLNWNGQLIDQKQMPFDPANRLIKYGDGVFETIKFAHGKLLFFEAHYFRLMASMRILRMEIPDNFSPEFLETQLLEVLSANHLERGAARLRLAVYRSGGGFYLPETNDVAWFIEATPLPHQDFEAAEKPIILDLFKDHHKAPDLLSTLKTSNSILYILAANFAKENGFSDVMLLNTQQEVTDTIASNIFLVKENQLITPPLSSGALRGVMRGEIIKLAPKMGLKVVEQTFSPFELQRSDEVWLSNTIQGLQTVAAYRKKQFDNQKGQQMRTLINAAIQS